MPSMALTRNMVVWRIPKTRELVIHSPVALSEALMQKFTNGELGKGVRTLVVLSPHCNPYILLQVKYIIVPNSRHRRDAFVFGERFPNAHVLCPAKAADAVR